MQKKIRSAAKRAIKSNPITHIPAKYIKRSLVKGRTVPRKLYERHKRLVLYARDNGFSVEYEQVQAELRGYVRRPNCLSAVVIHLYYTESWPLFTQKLTVLNKLCKFDLFITLPEKNRVFAETILETFPDARVVVVPNKGRDVLPFVQVMQVVGLQGYEYVLKIHSKKSVHRTDGQEWLSTMVESLIPQEQAGLEAIYAQLSDKQAGIIGPAGMYVSYLVNFEANRHHVYKAIKQIYSTAVARYVNKNAASYGFFAGTMFWARVDAIMPVVQEFKVKDFEFEAGQIDGTMAHGLERTFGLAAEIEDRGMFETDGKTVSALKYENGDIPDWAGVLIK